MASSRKKKVKLRPDRKPARRASEPISLYDAKTRLSELVDLAAAGQEITVAKSGKPLAKLVPLVDEARRALRFPGHGKGEWWVADDFDAPMSREELALFGIDSK